LQIKRTNSTTIKSSPKKLKQDNRFPVYNSKRIPESTYSGQTTSVALMPTICLAFPMQSELKPISVVVTPKATTIKKTIRFFSNRKSIISQNRMIYLMT
jgi:hypothetical protein